VELARAVHGAVHGRVSLELFEGRGDLRRPRDSAEVARVEDEAGLHVLRVVVGARRLVPLERRLHALRELRPELARLGREVGPRRGGVGEDERLQTGRVRERILLGEEAAPGLAEDVVAPGDPERVDEVVQLADEEIHRPELGAAVGVVGAAPVPYLVVVDDRPAVGEVDEREEVVVRRAGAAVEGDERRRRRRVAGPQLAGNAVPGLRLAEGDRALAHLHARDSTPAV